MTDLPPLVKKIEIENVFFVSLKKGLLESEDILHTSIKNTYFTKNTWKNKEMHFIFELSPLYQKSLKSQFTTKYWSHCLNDLNNRQTKRFRVVFVLWVIAKNVKETRICKFKLLKITHLHFSHVLFL